MLAACRRKRWLIPRASTARISAKSKLLALMLGWKLSLNYPKPLKLNPQSSSGNLLKGSNKSGAFLLATKPERLARPPASS